jgi:hypothetical protein
MWYQWLEMLLTVNEHFRSREPRIQLRPRTEEVVEALTRLPDELLERAHIFSSEDAIRFEDTVRSGVAATPEDTPVGSVYVTLPVQPQSSLIGERFLRTVKSSLASETQSKGCDSGNSLADALQSIEDDLSSFFFLKLRTKSTL